MVSFPDLRRSSGFLIVLTWRLSSSRCFFATSSCLFARGLVTGVSGMMTKQSYALWSKNPNIDFIHKDFTNEAKSKEIPIEVSNMTEGKGKILGYTIINYDSKPKAVMYINASDGKRKLITSSDKSIIKLMENKEWVGKKIYFKENQLVS